jgi:hypothetical protein
MDMLRRRERAWVLLVFIFLLLLACCRRNFVSSPWASQRIFLIIVKGFLAGFAAFAWVGNNEWDH